MVLFSKVSSQRRAKIGIYFTIDFEKECVKITIDKKMIFLSFWPFYPPHPPPIAEMVDFTDTSRGEGC